MERNLTILFFILAGFILLLILLNCSLVPVKSNHAGTQHMSSYSFMRSAQSVKNSLTNFKTRVGDFISSAKYTYKKIIHYPLTFNFIINRIKPSTPKKHFQL
ncbi:MAG TPA: hypothetical protein PLP19_08710 [bacterium]|nr:hypothetical protein [bacterium]HPN43554.1 hypothetical protein [bacterium]